MAPFLMLLVILIVFPSTVGAQAVPLSDHDMDEITLRNPAPLAPCKLDDSENPCVERYPQIFSELVPGPNKSGPNDFQLPLNQLDNSFRANRFQVEQIFQVAPGSTSNGAPTF